MISDDDDHVKRTNDGRIDALLAVTFDVDTHDAFDARTDAIVRQHFMDRFTSRRLEYISHIHPYHSNDLSVEVASFTSLACCC